MTFLFIYPSRFDVRQVPGPFSVEAIFNIIHSHYRGFAEHGVHRVGGSHDMFATVFRGSVRLLTICQHVIAQVTAVDTRMYQRYMDYGPWQHF